MLQRVENRDSLPQLEILGPGFNLTVVEGQKISPPQQETIMRVRQSYVDMWGGNCRLNESLLWSNSDLQATHYIANLQGGVTITMRALGIHKHQLYHQSELPIDLTGWRLQSSDNNQPLLAELQNYFSRIPSLEPVVTVISRGASTSNGGKPEFDRDLAALAFAAINFHVASVSKGPILCELNPALQTKAFAIDYDNQHHVLNFIPTEKTLDQPNAKLVLDRRHQGVQELLMNYPGYWFDYNGLIKELNSFLSSGSPESALVASEFRRLIPGQMLNGDVKPILSGPSKVKLIIPLLKQFPGLFHFLLEKVPDGPFSAMIPASEWKRTCSNMIEVYNQKYSLALISYEP